MLKVKVFEMTHCHPFVDHNFANTVTQH